MKPKQLSLWDVPELVLAPVQKSLREQLVEQVMRDTAVLREESWYHAPSTEFFVERIAAYRAEILRYDAAQV